MSSKVMEEIYCDKGREHLVFKYYNSFYKLSFSQKKLIPIKISSVDFLEDVYGITEKVDSRYTSPSNNPVIYLKDKKDYGLILEKKFIKSETKINLKVKLLSSYFGVDNIIDIEKDPDDEIEVIILRFLEEESPNSNINIKNSSKIRDDIDDSENLDLEDIMIISTTLNYPHQTSLMNGEENIVNSYDNDNSSNSSGSDSDDYSSYNDNSYDDSYSFGDDDSTSFD